MAELGELVEKVRSKNAGPFWLTIDIFCANSAAYQRVCKQLTTQIVADLFRVEKSTLKRFEINSLNVVKFSFPRPVIQGTRLDRDMHGAQWAILLEEFEMPDFPVHQG